MSNRSGIGLLGQDLQSQLRKFGDLVWLSPSSNPNLGKIAPLAEFLRDGLLAYADGTNWNPGFGKGYYRYELATTSWKLAIPVAVNKTLRLGMTGLATGSTKPTMVTVGNFVGYEFSVGDDGFVDSFEIPYEWDTATNVKFKIHWYSANTTAARYCKWRLIYSSIAEGTENCDAAGVTVDTADILVPTTAYRLNETTITMVAANLALDDVIGCQVFRIASTGTAVTAEPTIVGLEIEYQTNKLGEAL